jgi:uridylate kinase
MDRPTADYMGMLATVMNALALQDELERQGLTVRVQSGITIQQVCEPYIKRRAERHLEKKRVVVFAGGTGNPFFTTDTAASLRAAEIEAEIILLAKNVDGVYDSDPKENPLAKKFDKLTFQEMIEHNLRAIDITAASLCKENNIPVLIFSLNEEDSIVKAVCGIESGTRLYNGEESS